MQVKIRIQIPKLMSVLRGDKVPKEQVDGILFDAVGEGV